MVSIRPAGPEDGGAVARVHEVARAAYYGAAAPADVDPARAAMWRAVIGDPARATVLCAEDGAGLVGFLSMGPPIHDDLPAGPVLELHALYVLPGRWGTGVAHDLYAAFPERLGRAAGTVGVLEVWDANRRAIRFYERRGWARDGRLRPGPAGSSYVGMSLTPPA